MPAWRDIHCSCTLCWRVQDEMANDEKKTRSIDVKKCFNHEGIVKFHEGTEIKCSRSWDGTYWFFFCDRCKKGRPHIRGVLRGVKIWHSPFMDRLEWTSDSEYSYYSSEGVPCTQDEAEERYLAQEVARIEALKSKAVESLSTRLITERLGTHLTGYTEIKLFRTCKQIYLGNRARGNWWANMNPDSPIPRLG